MKIIHMSDLHITEGGIPIWDTDTKYHFDLAIEKIKHEDNIDAIFITGDIADNGSKWAYEYVDLKMQQLGIPTYVCPGNHDWTPQMKQTLRFCKMEPCVEISGWKFILLDSTIPDEDLPEKNRARGVLSKYSLSVIEDIANTSISPICILLHHSPLEPGSWLNKKILENRDEFKSHINGFKNIKLVLFGHVHYPFVESQSKITYVSAPSIGFAFDPNLNKYEIAKGCEGYNLIEVVSDDVLVKTVII